MLPWETDPANYHALFKEKCDRVEARFQVFEAPPATRFSSPPEAYRIRTEFRIWHDGDELDYVMFDPADRRTPVPVRDFVPALAPIRELMEPLRICLRDTPELRRKLFQVEFMAARCGDCVVTLIYHRPLDDHWQALASELSSRFSVHVVGRSRRQKMVIGRDWINERYRVGGREYRYRQYEQSFVQPNGPVNEKMLNWVWERSSDVAGDLLELYCGNGNFTLPLCDRHRRVVATELAKSGTRAALENQADNGIENLAVVRLSAEEVSQALDGVREFRRLSVLPEPLHNYDLQTVFVDPPRAGLDESTLRCVARFPRIVYVSCNPDTLIENIGTLATTHRIGDLAFFDQFPYTHHLESGVILEKR